MAKVLQTTLQISESNVEQYCTADGLSLNTGGYAIRLYLNGHTQGSAILNNAAKEVLYPSATAHPFKIDSFIRANKSGGKMTISLQFDGTSVQSETGDWGSGLKNKTKEGISDPVVINSNRSTEIKWHIKGSSTVSRFSIASTKLTFYFNQYEMRPLVGDNANGIQKVTVSNASPCYGDTVVFTPKLVQGATWAGWYSDAACTNLVSADQNYSVSPSSDIILYAKATIDATLYNVSTVAGAEITSVNVSDSIVPEGGTTTFTAQVNTGCSFEAWYSDDTYTTVVSTENPYTATITANTTLYAKAHRNSLNISVGSAEHGTASVSATTVPYGNDVTFTFTPEDDTWELYGWYSDSGLTQLVSEANPYTFTATEDVTLYPKVGRIRYKITFKSLLEFDTEIKAAVLNFDALNRTEKSYLKVGNYEAIEQSKVFDIKSDSVHAIIAGKALQVEILCPLGMTVAFWGIRTDDDTRITFIKDADFNDLTSWPYYWYQPSKDATFRLSDQEGPCDCSAIAKEGISYADATTPTRQEREAIFEAEVASGYVFSGWYSDEACTKLVSTDNPAHVTTPKYTTESVSRTSLTLYAKATKAIYTIGVGTTEHGNASVSANTAYYGDTVTFNCTVDEGYEFKGWYSDEGLTQLVSESAEYVHNVTGDVTLWAKVELIKYTITLTRPGRILWKYRPSLKLAVVNYAALTREEINLLKAGDYDKIEQSKVLKTTQASGLGDSDIIATIECPYGLYVAMYVSFNIPADNTAKYTQPYINDTTWWPYYWYVPTGDKNFTVGESGYRCDCVALPLTGIEYVDVTTPVVQTKNAIFTAKVKPGYKFDAWYSDEACTIKASANNPATVTTPQGELINDVYNQYGLASLTLYAKAVPLTSTTGLSFKSNGTWKNALAVFKKTNGAWVQQSNPASLFSGSPSGTESNYLYLGE